jgi:hypothetical protein
MPTVKNLSYGSLAIQVRDDHQIVLGPRESKDIGSDDFESEGIQKILRDGTATVLLREEPPAKKPKPKPIST